MQAKPSHFLHPLVLLFVLASIIPCGCNTSSDSGPESNAKRIILLTNGDDPFWDAARKGIEKAAEEFNLADSNLQATMDKGNFSEGAQIDKLNQYATQTDIAAVAISPVDAKNKGIADAMKVLRDKGVHVITIDSDMDDKSCRFAYIGTNNIIGGRELGKAAKGLRPEGGKYATFVGVKTVANAIERIGGFAEGAGELFVSRDSLADDGDENLAQENVKVALNNNSDIDTLVGIWAYNAHAIVQVVKERGLSDNMTIVVFDAAQLALEHLKNGDIDAMVVQNPYQMGFRGTQLMKALIEDDQATITEMYPNYDASSNEFSGEGADIYTTELRVVVPDEGSPLSADMFNSDTKFFKYSEFQNWLRDRGLKSS